MKRGANLVVSRVEFQLPCHTVVLGCISGNAAIASIVGLLKSGYLEVGIAGGVEFTSDGPIRYDRTVSLMREASRVR